MKNDQSKSSPTSSNHPTKTPKQEPPVGATAEKPIEVGGPKGPEPTRYGDWQQAGRCTDF